MRQPRAHERARVRGCPVTLTELAGALGYTVLASDALPFYSNNEDGTQKRTDYIVSEREKKVWFSRAAFEALKK